MSERAVYDIVCLSFLGAGAAVFVALFFIAAPYGRHFRGGWGPKFPASWGWLVMESVSSLGFLGWYLAGEPSHTGSAAGIALLILWQAHYAHRAFIYPFTRRGGRREMPLSVVAMGLAFNLGNAYLNARWLYELGPVPALGLNPHTVIGLALYAAGYLVNRQADAILRELRRPEEQGYRIPYGGAYRWISCPNYLGECVEWIGWAILTWSPGGAVFALWTVANLAPRARSHHRWYQKTFPDYPRERRAMVPFIF